MDKAGFGTVVRRCAGRLELGRTGHVTSTWPPEATTKKPAWESSSRPGSHVSPACLAIYLTWLQAGRLKSPRDKSCSYSPPSFPSRQSSDKAVKGHIPVV